MTLSPAGGPGVHEGEQLEFTVDLGAPAPAGGVTVNYAFGKSSDSAEPGTNRDYTMDPADTGAATGSVPIDGGSRYGTITLDAKSNGDTTDETATVWLTSTAGPNASNYAVDTTPQQVTIYHGPVPQATVSYDSTNQKFVITMNPRPTRNVDVQYKITNTSSGTELSLVTNQKEIVQGRPSVDVPLSDYSSINLTPSPHLVLTVTGCVNNTCKPGDPASAAADPAS